MLRAASRPSLPPSLLQLIVRASYSVTHSPAAREVSQQKRYEPTHNPFPAPRLDYESLAINIAAVSKNASQRNVPIAHLGDFPVLHRKRKEVRRVLEVVNAERNLVSDLISASKGTNEEAILQARDLRAKSRDLTEQLHATEAQLMEVVLALPNSSHPSAPIGAESAAVVLSMNGPPPIPSNKARDNVSIANSLGILNLTVGALVTGNSWCYLSGELASMELALVNYALQVSSKRGWKLTIPPDVVKEELANRCGFRPRDGEVSQMYRLESQSDATDRLVLSGTAEIPLAGLFAFQLLNPLEFPARVVGVGKAFRAEAGARGADTRGLYRVHQFTKVELFAVTAETESEEMMEEMLQLQKEIIGQLGVPFRVLDMPTWELGASAYRKYDIEAWMPGRGKWGEVTSLSNCTDYQSRRLYMRYDYKTLHRKKISSSSATPSSMASEPDADLEPDSEAYPGVEATEGATSDALSKSTDQRKREQAPKPDPRFPHTLNGTAAAIPRLLVALLENGAVFSGGSVVRLRLPMCLRRYWVGPEERIEWVAEGEALSGPVKSGAQDGAPADSATEV